MFLNQDLKNPFVGFASPPSFFLVAWLWKFAPKKKKKTCESWVSKKNFKKPEPEVVWFPKKKLNLRTREVINKIKEPPNTGFEGWHGGALR